MFVYCQQYSYIKIIKSPLPLPPFPHLLISLLSHMLEHWLDSGVFCSNIKELYIYTAWLKTDLTEKQFELKWILYNWQ